MRFEANKVAFGRHETFPLRYSWLTKGYDALKKDPAIFTSDEATVILGVGRNMVNAIRYWMMASRLIEQAPEKGYQPTVLGKLLLDPNGYDPYLEDEATIWLLHWLISSNAQLATTWFWFFNQFHKPTFKSQEVVTALQDFVKREVTTKTSPTTVKNDAAIMLRMYAGAKVSSKVSLEDLLDSPLSSLDLVQRSDNNIFSSAISDQEDLPIFILGYAVHELMQNKQRKEIPIEELLVSSNGFVAPGAIFRITENALITKLEQLVELLPDVFEIRETAGIHQLYLIDEIETNELLQMHYAGAEEEVAA